MINFYGKLTKIMIIVLTTTSTFLLTIQNATWKACAWNGQKKAKGQDKKNTKKSKNDKEDDTSVSSEDHDTDTSRASTKNNKNAPLEVQHHSSSAESDSSRKEDDDSNDDEPELQESPNKTTPECTTVSDKTHGEKKTDNTVVKKRWNLHG